MRLALEERESVLEIDERDAQRIRPSFRLESALVRIPPSEQPIDLHVTDRMSSAIFRKYTRSASCRTYDVLQ